MRPRVALLEDFRSSHTAVHRSCPGLPMDAIDRVRRCSIWRSSARERGLKCRHNKYPGRIVSIFGMGLEIGHDNVDQLSLRHAALRLTNDVLRFVWVSASL